MQFFKCQNFSHKAEFCHIKDRCVKCTGAHNTWNCMKDAAQPDNVQTATEDVRGYLGYCNMRAFSIERHSGPILGWWFGALLDEILYHVFYEIREISKVCAILAGFQSPSCCPTSGNVLFSISAGQCAVIWVEDCKSLSSKSEDTISCLAGTFANMSPIVHIWGIVGQQLVRHDLP